jgi:endoglucanase
MKIKTLSKTVALLGLLAGTSSAKFMPYAERVLKYPTEQGWETNLQSHWTYWKAKFLNSDGTITATKPDGTAAKVSEAQAYGMLLALWFNDKASFDKIYLATQNSFYNSGSKWYKWIISPTTDANFAGDADQDILGALIFASALVDSGVSGWSNPSNGAPAYKTQALTLLSSIYTNFVDAGNGYRINSWPSAGDGIRNPSYHMPGWYQVFKEFAAKNSVTGQNWDGVRTGAYALMNAQPNAAKGMARNFSSGSGGSPSGGTSSPNNYDMGFDACRVPWRMGLDAMWYPSHSQAVSWCKSVWNSGFVKPDTAGMYTISGPTLWGWGTYNASNGPYSDAQYEWAMTVALWGAASVAVADSCSACTIAAARSIGRIKTGVTKQDYFVISANTDTTQSASPNKNYYAQTLALLATLAMDGRAWNVWDDLMNKWTAPDTSTKMVTNLTATPSTLDLTTTTHLYAKFSHDASVKLTFTGKTSGTVYTTAVQTTADTVSLNFTPGTNHPLGKTFTAGEQITVTIVGPWTTAPAGATTTLTINASSINVRREHRSVLGWTAEGLRIPADLLADGQSVQVRVLDLAGRQQGPVRQAVSRSAGQDAILDIAPQRTNGAGMVELRSGDAVELLLLPPVR